MRLLQLFLFFFLATHAMAQIVNIPDPKFKNALINTKCDYSVFYDPDDVDKNNNGEIEVDEARQVQILHVPSQGITSLTGIEAFTRMQRLQCANNQLTNLNYTFPAVFDSLNCSNNPLDTLDLSIFTNLIYLGCNRLNLDTLSLVALTNLRTLECTGNRLKYLDLRAQATLLWFDCSGNQLREMYLKNGQRQYEMKFANNPALRYICCDSTELSAVQDSVTKYGLSNCTVSTFCAPGSGGKVYTVQGRALLDLNGNGCDTADRAFAYLPLRVVSSSDVGDFLANASGNFSFSLPAGSYTITPRVEQPAYFQVTPLSIALPEPTDTLTTAFCISANGTYPDLEVTLVPLAVVRPGFETSYRIGYKNKGTTVQSGNLVVEYDDDQFDFVSASQPVKSQSAGTATWDFSNLAPLQERHFDLVLRAHTPVQISPLQLGDTVVLTARIESAAQDASPADNTFELTQIAVGSYDPNDKTCLQGPVLLPEAVGKDYLHYLIRFENTGTFAAENVVVRDTLDTQVFDLSTLYMVGASHSMSTRLTQNRVEFSFPNIQLPFDDANNDGYVLFKIKTKPNLPIGTLLKNRAGIYFDFNAPIITNVAETVVDNKNDPVIFIPDPAFKYALTQVPRADIQIDGVISTDAIVDKNRDGEIQLSEAQAVEALWFFSQNIENPEGVQYFTNMISLGVSGNLIRKLDVQKLEKLQLLDCSNNEITEMILPNDGDMLSLYCGFNQLTTLVLPPGLVKLRSMGCGPNKLTILEFPKTLTDMDVLDCRDNELTYLNLENLPSLSYLFCSSNKLTQISIEKNKKLNNLICRNNQLTDMYLKNGTIAQVAIENNPLLTYICCDEDEQLDLLLQARAYIGPDCVVNSYCSEKSLVYLHNFRGKTIVDFNSNNCDADDPTYPYFKFSYNHISKTLFGLADGTYNTNASIKWQNTLSPVVETPSYFSINPPSVAPLNPLQYDTVTQNICLTPKGNYNDLETVLLPESPARPGHAATYRLIGKNKGTVSASGTLTLEFNTFMVKFEQSFPPAQQVSNGLLTWDFSNLRPYESKEIEITFEINGSNIQAGNELLFKAFAQAGPTEETPRDNTFKLVQKASNIDRTNDIICLQGPYISQEQADRDYLHYMIRFENIGTDTVRYLPIANYLDVQKFDLTSVEIVDASHPASVRQTYEILEFIFDSLNLSPHTPHNRGYVAFKIKPAKPFVDTLLKNTALIHFSPSQPIRTNEAITIIRPTVGTQHIGEAGRMRVYPNPAGEQVYFDSSEPVEQVCIFDAAGRLFKCVENNPVYIITKDWPSGVYSARIWSGGHLYVARIVK